MSSPYEPPPITELHPDPGGSEAFEARLTESERVRWLAYPAEKRRQDWLLGRAAAKQAVRAALLRGGRDPLDWLAFEIRSGPSGAPVVHADPPLELAVSLTHGHDRAAAWAMPPGAAGGLPGVDLERIRARRQGTLRFYLHPPERGWIEELPLGSDRDPSDPDRPPGPRDVAAIVMWALKEAAFKALQPPRGTGLLDVAVELGDPFDAPRGTARVTYRGQADERADRLGVREVRGGWTRDGEFVLAWTHAVGARLPED